MAGLVDRDTNGLSPEVYQSLTTYEAWDEEASCLRQVVEALNSSLEAIHQAIEVPRYALDEETAKLIPAEAQERELFEMIEALVVSNPSPSRLRYLLFDSNADLVPTLFSHICTTITIPDRSQASIAELEDHFLYQLLTQVRLFALSVLHKVVNVCNGLSPSGNTSVFDLEAQEAGVVPGKLAAPEENRTYTQEDFLHLSRLCVQRVVDEEGVYALLECMQADISMEIREYCAHSIYLLARCGEMGRLSVVVQKGLDYLLTSLTSERSPNVRLQAAEALVQIAPSCVDELIKPAVLESVFQIFNLDALPVVRACAIRTLSAIPDAFSDAVPLLLQVKRSIFETVQERLVSESSLPVMEAILVFLRKLVRSEHGPALCEILGRTGGWAPIVECVALEIPVALEAVRTLRALLELSSPTLEIGSKIFHHFQVFASILQAITEEESRDVSLVKKQRELKTQLAVCVGIVLCQFPECRVHMRKELVVLPTWMLSVRRGLLHALSFAQPEDLIGLEIVDCTGIKMNILPQLGVTDIGTKAKLVIVSQEKRADFLSGIVSHEDVDSSILERLQEDLALGDSTSARGDGVDHFRDDVSEAGTATTLDLSELSMASPREDVRGPQNRSQPGQEEYVQCTFTLELFRWIITRCLANQLPGDNPTGPSGAKATAKGGENSPGQAEAGRAGGQEKGGSRSRQGHGDGRKAGGRKEEAGTSGSSHRAGAATKKRPSKLQRLTQLLSEFEDLEPGTAERLQGEIDAANERMKAAKVNPDAVDQQEALRMRLRTLMEMERKQDMQLAETQDVLRRIMLYDPSLSTQARALLGESMMNNIEVPEMDQIPFSEFVEEARDRQAQQQQRTRKLGNLSRKYDVTNDGFFVRSPSTKEKPGSVARRKEHHPKQVVINGKPQKWTTDDVHDGDFLDFQIPFPRVTEDLLTVLDRRMGKHLKRIEKELLICPALLKGRRHFLVYLKTEQGRVGAALSELLSLYKQFGKLSMHALLLRLFGGEQLTQANIRDIVRRLRAEPDSSFEVPEEIMRKLERAPVPQAQQNQLQAPTMSPAASDTGAGASSLSSQAGTAPQSRASSRSGSVVSDIASDAGTLNSHSRSSSSAALLGAARLSMSLDAGAKDPGSRSPSRTSSMGNSGFRIREAGSDVGSSPRSTDLSENNAPEDGGAGTPPSTHRKERSLRVPVRASVDFDKAGPAPEGASPHQRKRSGGGAETISDGTSGHWDVLQNAVELDQLEDEEEASSTAASVTPRPGSRPPGGATPPPPPNSSADPPKQGTDEVPVRESSVSGGSAQPVVAPSTTATSAVTVPPARDESEENRRRQEEAKQRIMEKLRNSQNDALERAKQRQALERSQERNWAQDPDEMSSTSTGSSRSIPAVAGAMSLGDTSGRLRVGSVSGRSRRSASQHSPQPSQ